MNVLLTTSAAPKKSPFSTDEKRPPLGVGSLLAVLRNAGHQVHFIDNYLAPARFLEEGYVQRHQIDLVGIYANTVCYRDTLRMFHALEQLRQQGQWHGKIAVGGPHTTIAVETIPDFVDYIVQGEGEQALLSILEHTATQRILGGTRLTDLETLPFQPWDIFAQLPYDYTCPWMESTPVFTMNTSRGCPFHCTFCSVKSIWGTRYTYMSPERIIAEIEYLVKQFNAKGIYFREDHFTLNARRTREFCEQMLEKPFKLDWACETRVDNLSEDLLRLMSASGCKALYLGIESGSQRILDALQKQISVEQIERVITWCKRYNIRTYCSLIAGTPGETFEDYLHTQRLMDRLKPYRYSFNVFIGIPGSQLYQDIIDNHLYEYIDELGFAYLPGYDVKTKFFYYQDSSAFVDHTFTQRTEFDKQLLKHQYQQTIRRFTGIGRAALSRYIPETLKQYFRR